jgi:hypothetical protein
MKKTFFHSIVLAIAAIAFLVWAISCDTGSLAWFPGFIMSVFCCMRILDINKVGQDKSERNSR